MARAKKIIKISVRWYYGEPSGWSVINITIILIYFVLEAIEFYFKID